MYHSVFILNAEPNNKIKQAMEIQTINNEQVVVEDEMETSCTLRGNYYSSDGSKIDVEGEKGTLLLTWVLRDDGSTSFGFELQDNEGRFSSEWLYEIREGEHYDDVNWRDVDAFVEDLDGQLPEGLHED